MIGKHFFAEKKTTFILFLLLLTGFFITYVCYKYENFNYSQELKRDFKNNSKIFSQIINDTVKNQLALIKSTQCFFMASEFVTMDEFEIFTKPYLNAGKGVSTIIWAKKVTDKEKKSFESEISALQGQDICIREFSVYGQSREVSGKSTYNPVLYLVTEDPACSNIWGYDLDILNCPECVSRINNSSDPILCVCSHARKYFPSSKNYLLMAPVPIKSKSQGKPEIDGIILMVIDIKNMIKELTPIFTLNNISFDVYDMNNSKKRLIFSYNEKAEIEGMESTFEITDSSLLISIYPNKNYSKKYAENKQLIILPAGVIITLLLLLFIRSIMAKEKYAKKLVAAKTHDLEAALELKNSIFNNGAAGLILTTGKHEVIDVNEKTCSILGYSPDEIKSKSINILYKSNDYFVDFIKNFQDSSFVNGAELELLRKDGTTAWCFVSGKVIKQNLNIWVIHDITENKLIQDKIIEHEENIKIFFDAAASLIFIIDKNMNILYANNTAEKRTNYSHAELRNMKITNLYSLEYRTRAETEFRDIISGKNNTCTLPITAKSGKTIPVDSKTAFGKWHGQESIFIILNDVSGIEEEHKKFVKAFQNNPTPMLITDIETGEFIEINDAFTRLFGYDNKDLVGRSAQSALYVHPEKRHKIIEHINQYGYLKNYYIEFHDKHGGEKDIMLNAEIINISDKNYYLSSLTDMTSIKQTEKSLKESEERWKFALEGSGDGIWDWEVNTDHVFYSTRAKALLGYENNELEGSYNDFISRLHPDDKIQTVNSLQVYLDGKTEIYQSEHRLRCKSGSYIWVLARGKTMSYNEKGNPKRLIGTLTDISWHKEIENELRSARAEADSANQAKSRFLANTSHEIRTPLHGIIGLTELVLTTDLTENQRKYIENLKSSAYSLLDILNEILDISKIESGKFKPAETDFDIYSFLEKSITIFSAKCLEKDIELILDIRPEFPDLLTGDAVRIRQIISNLLSNAVKFTHHGEIILSVRKAKIQPEEPNKISVDFSVKDTGIGIPSDKIAYIFESFNQIDNSITRNYGGTGLGLTISKNLAEMMGGHLTASSRENEGSTFTLSIPLSIRNPKMKIWENEPRYKKILILDDKEPLLKVLADIMNFLKIECSIANNNEDALTMFNLSRSSGTPYDLVFIDLASPNPENILMIKNIKSSARNHNTRIVPFISITTNIKQPELESLKINKFLVKPLKLTEIYNVLTKKEEPDSDSALQKMLIPSSNGNSHKYKILVVEDNTVNTIVIIDILKNMGFDATAVSNGADAIKEYRKNTFDLIFMDIHIPGMDGFEITGKIRKVEAGFKQTPIVALSADTSKDEIEKALQAGINHYICKPFSVSDIADAINKFLPGSITLKTYSDHTKTVLSENTSIFDRETFMMMINNNNETYKKLITTAKKEIPAILEKIKTALEESNYSNVLLYSHELKGTSSNLRAMKIFKIITDIEQKAKDSASVSEIHSLFTMLPPLFSEFISLAEKQSPS